MRPGIRHVTWIVLLAAAVGCAGDTGVEAPSANAPPLETATTALPADEPESEPGVARPPSSLALPFRIEQLDNHGGFFVPFGVVRWSRDRSEFGHSGIDIPLRTGAELLAVGDGVILSVEPNDDHLPGSIIALLLDGNHPAGEGWAFLYEHARLADALAVGDRVERGQPVGTSALERLTGNNHLQLTYTFEAHRFYRNHTCWPAALELPDRRALEERFESISDQEGFATAWSTAEEEGKHPYRALLEEQWGPPRLCYPAGTDVRVVADGEDG
jgi:hypothetical protein